MTGNSLERPAGWSVKEYMKLFTILSLIMVVTFSGCGVYTFNPKGKSTISAISIERFENRTGEYGLEDRMTDLIIEAFIADGSMEIVPTENAEALLVGTLTRYNRRPFDPDENDQVTSYAVTMYFDIKLINPIDNTEIWTDKINQEGIYNLETESEEDGQFRAIKELIEHIINKTTKSW